MKSIRLLAGILLLISGVLHVVAYFQAPDSQGSIPVISFGIIYMILGALLFNRNKYPLYLAIIVPIIGMTLSLIKFGIPELVSLSALFKVLEIIAIICCVVLLINSKNPNKLYAMKNLSANRCGKQLVLFLSLLVTAIPQVFSQNQPGQTDLNNHPLVTVRLTETRSFYSKILDQEMVLYIKIPATYNTDTQKIYPCYYGTDGNRSFAMVADMANSFEVPEIVEPEIFVVGIGYKIRDLGDWGAWRTRDLTPTNIPSSDTYWAGIFSKFAGREFDVKTGGAGKFLECIEKEVLPFMESNYRVSSTGRGLGGYSYGGLFSLYVLFKRPELFSLYFAGSPSIRYDKGVLYTYEKEYAAAHNDLNATLFMTAGGAEDSALIANVNILAARLESRNYPGLKVETTVFPDETHMSCVPAAWMRAFMVLYKK